MNLASSGSKATLAASGAGVAESVESVEKRTLHRLFWRIVPFIMFLYFIAFIDRVNIGFAALTMNKDIGLSPAVYGFGAGIFFFGYFIF